MNLIKQVREYGFQALENIEIDFEPNNILVGSNNSGKTKLLKTVNEILVILFTVCKFLLSLLIH